ncbi:tRNA (guanosine(46)-N7)-methyltransferase TrmB [Candidatus Ishikawella capsulata]|uniref:tRNA (guanine-N(7)-)-methyltransferase n=1 Tax=Candidatus Ishikawaella capsulata Mpkobe TaxID=476281 RepID=C5WDK0_9ENTR|nr:tRNA (guanosine(46)-N7)-methyltransferase TrmB [Candidatus Ishikawaella capsulata]BAH83406.1 tRNA(m7G46)-methyltransferase [Candidatus Ishikawaella capsulata Mpkobe]
MINICQNKYNKNTTQFFYIRSFVLRQRRLTKHKKHIIENKSNLLVNFSYDTINMVSLFGNDAPVVMEIGFGRGDSLVEMTKLNFSQNFLGIEVYIPGISSCINLATREKITNLRLIHHNAVEVLEYMIPDSSLFTVQLFFPDTWEKKRHNKRRIVQIPFAELILRKLKIGGFFHIVTDSKNYAEHILNILNGIRGYKKQSVYSAVTRPSNRILTKFEQRAHIMGQEIWDIKFLKV